MSEHVWLSRAIADVSLVGKFDTDIWVENSQMAIQAEKLNKRGQPVPQDMCPKKIWGDDHAPRFKTIPHLISAQCHWIVSAQAADVLRQFDLGGGAIYPVTDGIFQKDQVTRVLIGQHPLTTRCRVLRLKIAEERFRTGRQLRAR